MSTQKRKDTVLQLYVPVAGLDVLWCHELDFQKCCDPLFAQINPKEAIAAGLPVGAGMPVGAVPRYHVVNAFIVIHDDVTGKDTPTALGQLDIYGTIVVRPVVKPAWWEDVKHERPGLGNVIKME